MFLTKVIPLSLRECSFVMCPGVPDSHFRLGKKYTPLNSWGKKLYPHRESGTPGDIIRTPNGGSQSPIPHIYLVQSPYSPIGLPCSHINSYFSNFFCSWNFSYLPSPTFFSNAPFSHPFYQNIPAPKYTIRGGSPNEWTLP